MKNDGNMLFGKAMGKCSHPLLVGMHTDTTFQQRHLAAPN